MFARTLGVVIAGMLCAVQVADAKESAERASVRTEGADFAPVYGRTLPPVGYVDFCAHFAKECAAERSTTSPRVELTPENWFSLTRINSYVNGKIRPVSDADLYQVPERWTYPVDAGDCEDYVLLKKRNLETLGFPSSALLITVVLDEHGEGHAVLTVVTDKGDFILDNRRDPILLWSKTEYQFLKRQTAKDPRQWVAMAKTTSSPNVSLMREEGSGN